MRWSLFPKALRGHPAKEVARVVREAGLDSCNVVIREGFWIEPSRLQETLESYVAAMRDGGVGVHWATTPWTAADLPDHEADLAALAGHGIAEVRLAQTVSAGGYGRVGDVRAELDAAGRAFADAAAVCAKLGLRAVYQLHHMTLLSSPSSIAPLLRDLDPAHFGVMIDPGNQRIEGHEDPRKAVQLLGSHLVGIGVKDVLFERDTGRAGDADKGWKFRMVPCDEGLNDWSAVGAALRSSGFDGTAVMMPFYPVDTREGWTATLKREVAYVRGHFVTLREGVP